MNTSLYLERRLKINMNLIDHFNAFQAVSECRGLSANARSLYFAILAEFNRQRFPASIKLSNAVLQHLSGIKSSSSFDSARNALINAGVIRHNKLWYELRPMESAGNIVEISPNNFRKTSEIPPKNFRKSSGIVPKDSIGLLVMPTDKYKDRQKEGDITPTAEMRARASEEILKAWELLEGEPLKGGVELGLIDLEKLYGTKAVVQAIVTASQANTRPNLSFNFVKAVLQRQISKKPERVAQVYGGDDDLPEVI